MKAVFVLSLALTVAPSHHSASAVAGTPTMAINEVLANPLDEDTGEFVELYNWGDAPVDLAGWRLADSADTNDTVIDFTGPDDWGRTGTVVPPGGYALIVDPEYAGEYNPFLRARADSTLVLLLTIGLDTTIGNGLTNSGDSVFVSDRREFQAAFGWACDPGQGVSWEKIEAQLGDDETNWGYSVDPLGSTPGARNSISRAQDDVRVLEESLRFMPPDPWPGQDVEIEVTVHNQGKTPASGIQVFFFLDGDADSLLDEGEQIEPVQVIDQPIPADEAVALRQVWLPPSSGPHPVGVWIRYPADEDPADNRAVAVLQVRFAPLTVVVNEIMYDAAPTGEDSSREPEWVEIHHRGYDTVDLARWSVEDSRGEPRYLCDSAAVLIPGGYALIAAGSPEDFHRAYPGVPGIVLFPIADLPTLNNDRDLVLLRDPAGTVIDSVLYEGDWGGGGGISLERISPQLSSNDPLNWSWCVHPRGSTPGESNSIYAPLVPSKVTLSVSPNPFSPDGDGHQEVTLISYRLPTSAAQMSLRLFDIRGRLVRTLVDQQRCSGVGEVLWDGRSDAGERLKMGIYIICLEALDDRRGLVCRSKTTVVLAGRLE